MVQLAASGMVRSVDWATLGVGARIDYGETVAGIGRGAEHFCELQDRFKMHEFFVRSNQIPQSMSKSKTFFLEFYQNHVAESQGFREA